MALDIAEFPEDCIELDGKIFKIENTINRRILPLIPAKLIEGDPSYRDRSWFPQTVFNNWVGGAGIREQGNTPEEERFWSSENTITFVPNQLTNGPLARTCTYSDETPITDAATLFITQFREKNYVVFGDAIHEIVGEFLVNVADEHTLPANATDQQQFSQDLNLYVAYNSGFSIFDPDKNSNQWTNHTGNVDGKPNSIEAQSRVPKAKHLAEWDGKLWAVCEDSSVYQSSTPAESNPNWIKKKSIPVPFGKTQRLLVYANAVGHPSLYAITSNGMFIYNDTSDRWENTGFTQLETRDGGRAATIDNDYNILYSAGSVIWKFHYSGLSRSIGFERDQGLPDNVRGHVVNLAVTPRFTLAFVNCGFPVDTRTPALSSVPVGEEREYRTGLPDGFYSEIGEVADSEANTCAAIFVDRGSFWHNIYVQEGLSDGVTAATIIGNNDYSVRAYWSEDDTLRTIKLPYNVFNPLSDPDYEYTKKSMLTTSWVNARFPIEDKVANKLTVELENMEVFDDEGVVTARNTIKIDYAIKYPGFNQYRWYRLMESSRSGEYIIPFLDELGQPTGLPNRAIRFRVTLERTDATTKTTPVLKSMVLSRMLGTELVYAYDCNIVIEDMFERPAEQQLQEYEEALAKPGFISFRYKPNGPMLWVKPYASQDLIQSSEVDNLMPQITLLESKVA